MILSFCKTYHTSDHNEQKSITINTLRDRCYKQLTADLINIRCLNRGTHGSTRIVGLEGEMSSAGWTRKKTYKV